MLTKLAWSSMIKRYAYADCYKILDVEPTCSWDELRRAYKLQIQKWHPDKFAENTTEKDAANDKIKRITTANQQLVAYYRRHGKLPAPETEPSQRKLPRPDYSQSVKSETVNYSQAKSFSSKKKSGLFPVFSGLIVIGFLFWYYSPEIRQAQRKTAEKINPVSANASSNTANQQDQYSQSALSQEPQQTGNSDNEKFITYGTTIGEVISIQGAPTHDEGNTWYYDDSELYFENGVVIGWKHMPGSKLKTSVAAAATN